MITGCVHYGPAGSSGIGFSDQPLSPGIYSVVFAHPFGRRNQIADLALLRASQVTLEEGYGYFIIDPVWMSPGPARGGVRYVIAVFEERPPLDPATVYDAAAMQAELVAEYAPVGALAVSRSPTPRWSHWADGAAVALPQDGPPGTH